MEKIKAYYELAKPGIIYGNIVTAVGGFLLASRGAVPIFLFSMTMIGLALIMASGCVFNNYIDRFHDQKMERTKLRPLATGTIAQKNSLIYGAALLCIGSLSLAFFSDPLALAIALMGFSVYVGAYSVLKYKTRHATLIGSISGAVPPAVGYCAFSGRFDLGALLIFLMVMLWQMPHFYAISIYRLKEYEAADIPILPRIKGIGWTKVQMLLYLLAFVATAIFLGTYGHAGTGFTIAAISLSIPWVILWVKGIKTKSENRWARQMFVYSLIVITGLSIMIPFSV